MSCCGSKKKPVAQTQQVIAPSAGQMPSNQVIGNATGVPIVPTITHTLASNNLRSTGSIAPSSLSRSRIALDKKLEKSKVTANQIEDPTVTNLFNDCRTQRIQLTKVTHEHNSYVRQHDYFDLSSGHRAELEAIRGLDTNPAKYTVSDSSTMSTPSINKFYYDRDVKDVGFHPSHQAYQGTYSAGFDKFGNRYNTSMVAPYSEPSNY